MPEILTSQEFESDYAKLKNRMEKGSREAGQLYALIQKATKALKSDPQAGRHVKRQLWPKEYVQKYGITNLWKYDLDSYWRLTYTITGDKIRLVLVYLEFMDHKEYDRRFGYKN